jgi:hypothetical protein
MVESRTTKGRALPLIATILRSTAQCRAEHHNEKMDFGGWPGRSFDRSASAVLRFRLKLE